MTASLLAKGRYTRHPGPRGCAANADCVRPPHHGAHVDASGHAWDHGLCSLSLQSPGRCPECLADRYAEEGRQVLLFGDLEYGPLAGRRRMAG